MYMEDKIVGFAVGDPIHNLSSQVTSDLIAKMAVKL